MKALEFEEKDDDFEWYDQKLLESIKKGDKDVYTFFTLLALCHTVMPEEKDGKVAGYPWGASFPPPKNNVGNYGDFTLVKKGELDETDLGDYDDGALLTAGVMSYPANKLGIFDLGGNVWEWCEDLYTPGNDSRVLRGGSWFYNFRGFLASSRRNINSPDYRNDNYGFRCVVVVGGSSP